MVAPKRKSATEPSETVTKIDLVILMITDLEKNMDLKFRNVENELASVKDITEMSRRALRGSNGDTGIIGELQKLIVRVASNEAAYCTLSDEVKELMRGKPRGSRESEENIQKRIDEAVNEDHVLRWSTVRDKVIWPVFVFLVMGALWYASTHGFLKP